MDVMTSNFTLRPIPKGFISKGGYYGVLDNCPIIGTNGIIEEAKVRKGLTGDTKLLRANLEAILDTAIELPMTQPVSARFDNYLLIRRMLKGWFENKTDRFDPEKHSMVLNVTCLKEMKTDMSRWTIHNSTQGPSPKIMDICTIGRVSDGSVEQGSDFQITGSNLPLLEGDVVKYSFKPESGEPLEGEVTVQPEQCSGAVITCTWPEALDATTVGGEVTFTVFNRCGNPNGETQKDDKTVTIVAGSAPAPTGDEPEIERGYSEGEGHPDGQMFPLYAFILQGLRFTGAAVKIGYVEEGTPREVDVPDEKLTVTDTVITIASDSVELEDAIAAGGTVTFKVTTEHGTATYEAEVQE